MSEQDQKDEWRRADDEVRKSLPPGVKLVRTLRGHTGWIGRIAWSPDGRMLATPAADNTIRLWDAETGECLHTPEGPKARSTALRSTGMAPFIGNRRSRLSPHGKARLAYSRPEAITNQAQPPGVETTESGTLTSFFLGLGYVARQTATWASTHSTICLQRSYQLRPQQHLSQG